MTFDETMGGETPHKPNVDVEDIEITDDEYLEDARRPTRWALNATQLWSASMILRREFDQASSNLDRPGAFAAFFGCLDAQYLLAGYAIESLLKGILVGANPDRWVTKDGNRIFRWPRNGHSLHELALAAGVELDATETDTLRELEGYIAWQGRYPLPNRLSTLREGDGRPDRRLNDRIDEIHARLRDLIEISKRSYITRETECSN